MSFHPSSFAGRTGESGTVPGVVATRNMRREGGKIVDSMCGMLFGPFSIGLYVQLA